MTGSAHCGGRRSWTIAGLGLLLSGLLGACTSQPTVHQGAQSGLMPAQQALVLPSGEMRSVQLLSGYPEPGSTQGPFFGRRDQRLGTTYGAPERLESGFERRIFDRQFSASGRPFNTYMDTTRTVTRVGQ